jgi:hypothetical protein
LPGLELRVDAFLVRVESAASPNQNSARESETMEQPRWTIIDDGRPVEVPASIAGGTLQLSPEALKAALGWELGPEGLCAQAACIPVPPGSSLMTGERVDLGGLAAILERPLALDLAERAGYLGVSARQRGEALVSLQAPDFALPDLDGRLHSLASHRGKKVLLVAYASW